jgi:hypothetical protein
MKRLAITLLALLLALPAVAQTEIRQIAHPGVALRASGNFTMVNVHFKEYPNRFQLGGGATLSAAYEHPLNARAIIGAGAGGSLEKTNAMDADYFYRTLTMSSIYAEFYYGFRGENGFFFDLGMQAGYTPPILSFTTTPEGGPALRRLSPYACKSGNVWFAGRVGKRFGPWEAAFSARMAMISPFGEAFPYPMLDYEDESAYRDVRARHLTVGVSLGYFFDLSK